MSNIKLLPAQLETKYFTAKLIEKHLIGADYYYYAIYDRRTNLKLGQLDAELGEFWPACIAGEYKLTIADMRNLAQFCGSLERTVANVIR